MTWKRAEFQHVVLRPKTCLIANELCKMTTRHDAFKQCFHTSQRMHFLLENKPTVRYYFQLNIFAVQFYSEQVNVPCGRNNHRRQNLSNFAAVLFRNPQPRQSLLAHLSLYNLTASIPSFVGWSGVDTAAIPRSISTPELFNFAAAVFPKLDFGFLARWPRFTKVKRYTSWYFTDSKTSNAHVSQINAPAWVYLPKRLLGHSS